MLDQSAAMAAAIALSEKIAVQDEPYDALSVELLTNGQILTAPSELINGNAHSVNGPISPVSGQNSPPKKAT